MKITKRQLRRLIKEEMAHVLFEAGPSSVPSIWSWLDQAGLKTNTYDPQQLLARAMFQAIAGGTDEKDLKTYVVKKLKPFVDESQNELDPDVKEAGGPEGYRKLQFEVLAGMINDLTKRKKSSGSKSKVAASTGGSKHMQRIKKGLGK